MMDKMKTGFFRTLWLLRDYLSEIVIGGGWVPMIYYHYLLGDKTKEPVRTRDIDFLIRKNIPMRGKKTLDQLLTDAGLTSTLKGLATPPAQFYEGEIDGLEVEIEFLTDQKGPKEDEVVTVQRGLNAQALRFVSVSLENSMEVVIDDFYDGKKPELLIINVPTPCAFIFHKGLVFPRRKEPLKKAKDLYYIFDVLVNLDTIEDQIHSEMVEMKNKYPAWFKRFFKNLEKYFAEPRSEGVDLVFSQRPQNALSALTDDQFKQYVFRFFNDFVLKTKSI